MLQIEHEADEVEVTVIMLKFFFCGVSCNKRKSIAIKQQCSPFLAAKTKVLLFQLLNLGIFI